MVRCRQWDNRGTGVENRREDESYHCSETDPEIPLHQLDLKLGLVGYFTSIYFVVFIENLYVHTDNN